MNKFHKQMTKLFNLCLELKGQKHALFNFNSQSRHYCISIYDGEIMECQYILFDNQWYIYRDSHRSLDLFKRVTVSQIAKRLREIRKENENA